ncbi:MAG TPA: hypothetical protein VMG10_36300, partial [Gemmataceae bacterium]|nr:hypothetical protein [Gemmataceae bacterium]
SLGTVLAIGLSSLTYFLWCVWMGPRQPGLFATESLVFGGLAIAFWRAGDVSPLLRSNSGLTPPARQNAIANPPKTNDSVANSPGCRGPIQTHHKK